MPTGGSPHTLLEQLIRSDARGYEQIAEELEAEAYRRGIEATMSAKHLSRLARGERSHETCRAGTRRLLEFMFGRSFAELFEPPRIDAGLLLVEPVAAKAASSLPNSVAALGELTGRDLDQVDRLDQLEVDHRAWGRLIAGWLGDPNESATEVGSRHQLTRADVDVVRAATEMFASFDYRYGGGSSRMLVVQCLASNALPRLRHTSTNDPLGREYFGEVSALTRLAAWSAYDTGHHGLAQRYFALALRFAQAAGDRALGGRILAGMSHQANYLGEYTRAVELAQAAHHGARGMATPTTLALFHAMEARAFASLGDETECTKALLQAEQSMARRNPDNDPSWIHYFDAAELHAEHAHCFRDLGRPGLSHEHAELSLAEAGSIYVRSRGFVTTVVATSHLLRGDVEQALDVAGNVVNAAQQLQSSRIVTYLDQFRQRLLPYSTDNRVKEFEDHVRTHVPGLEGAPLPDGRSVA